MISNKRFGIDEFTFFVNNPPVRGSTAVSLWVTLTNGLEYPIFAKTVNTSIYCTRHKDRNDAYRIEPSNEFWEYASHICPSWTDEEVTVFVQSLPETMATHEAWALWLIATFYDGRDDELGVLMEWANNKESTLFDFE